MIVFGMSENYYVSIPRVSEIRLFKCRGQVVRLRAPWIKHYYNNSGKFYIIPNIDSIVCGGTLQKDNWSTEVTEVGTANPTTKTIQNIVSCAALPSMPTHIMLIGKCKLFAMCQFVAHERILTLG